MQTLHMGMRKRVGKEAVVLLQDSRKIMVFFCDWTAQPSVQNLLLSVVCPCLLTGLLF